MGKVDRHLEVELLSALADGELDLSTMRDAKAHIEGCALCAGQLAGFRRLDDALLSPASLSCEDARELRSALLDGELSADEAAIATSHLAACADCGREQAAWRAAETALASLPAAMPSAATDARVMRLVAPAPKPRFPLAGPDALRPLALRGAVAAALVLALLFGFAPPGGPEQALVPGAQSAVVASVQQVVLYAATNTLYVLQPGASAVDAVDASSYQLRARISVGGRPSALALSATSVLVLDPAERSLVEIDPHTNTVVSTTAIPIAGTPTSVQVDPTNGRIIVAAIPDQPGGAVSTPIVTTTQNTGVVAVLDPATKRAEVVSSVDVAPKLVVTDSSGKQTLLVSTAGTTVVGKDFKKTKTLPGGVSAAFGAKGDLIVVLAREGSGAVLYFNGDGAPGPLRLVGVPLAVTSVPDVGFAVLLGATSGSGNGRIVVVDEAGRAVGSTDVTQTGRDLAYDPASKRFTVVGTGIIASAPLPAGIVAEASAAAPAIAPASPRPSPDSVRDNATAPPQATATPAPSPSPSAAPSATVAAPSATPAAPVAASPSLPPGIPASATIVGLDLYHMAGRVPVLVASSPLKVWFLDSANGLNAINSVTGEVFPIARLPKDAEISALAVGGEAVYLADARNSLLWSLDLRTEHLSSRPLPFVGEHTLMKVADDGRIWFAAGDQSQLISYDPHGKRVELVDTGTTGVAALAIDGAGRIWFTDGDRMLAGYDPATGALQRTRLASRGAARVLLPDPSGSIWVGTAAGEVISVRGGIQVTPFVANRPISALALDARGVTWYLTPASSGRTGFAAGRVYGGEAFTVPGPAISLSFTLGGRIWLADPSGGFYLSTEAPK